VTARPRLLARALVALAALQLAACAGISPKLRQHAVDYADHARSDALVCTAAPCAGDPSPLLDLGPAAIAASTPGAPHHAVVLLDGGQDSLLARLNLIRGAHTSIDLQTFHFERDDAGRVVLDALMDAARRGVRVRLLMDQLSGLADPELQARLAGFHRNFDLRLYNPIFDQAQVSPLEFGAAILFRFRDINRRMHNKVMVVDGVVGVVGGRNIQDEYFDWHPEYDYRDRDLLVAGPVAAAMTANFEAFWNDPRALPPAALGDVARVLVRGKGPPPAPKVTPPSARVVAMAAAARNGAAVFARLQPYLRQVGSVEFFADLPSKHDRAAASRGEASQAMFDLVAGTRDELLLQTPYLVMSRPARQLFRGMQKREHAPRIRVSTNSLAATDAFPVYAMSHKYKRLYLRELGFEIHEFKPFPDDAPIAISATGAVGDDAAAAAVYDPDAPAPPRLPGSAGFRALRDGPVPLKRAGVRIGLHAKSLVIDRRVGVVGSHNFDPRSSDFNTESLVVVHDEAFAEQLAASIERDMEPGNAWTIAPKEKLPVLWALNYNLGKLSEKLPIFDIWPFPYATSFELKPGCTPRPPSDPTFYECYEPVGDFPEVNLTLKGIYTRILTVFGAGFLPIL
jgi:phosphatidylserine/phosphatidylglycerophosphate/cardiolipin synthase-like enzyme